VPVAHFASAGLKADYPNQMRVGSWNSRIV
jgi:hypothetical protein